MTQPTTITDLLRLWDYTISHEVALFRRPASDTEPENLDLLFVAVEYFALPTSLHGLEIAEGSSAELAALGPLIGRLPSWAKLFVITSQGQRHLIVAGGWSLQRNRRELLDTGIRPPDAGVESTVLARSTP
jgi:hypothetical protein